MTSKDKQAMERKYVQPHIKVKAMVGGGLMAASGLMLDGKSPTSGLGRGQEPGYGGTNDGTHEPDAKGNSLWDEEE